MVNCPDVDHIEEEVQLRVQVQEKIGETHGKKENEEQRERTNDQVAHMGDHADEMTRTNTFLNHAVSCATISACSLHEKK